MRTTDRTWALVHLEHIAHNYEAIRTLLPKDCRFLAPLKADAYGHGAIPVARLLTDLGCDYLAVACLTEAVALREAGISLPILVLGHSDPSDAPLMAERQITQAVFSLETARALSQALAGTGFTLSIHIKLDTGMGRLGFPVRNLEPREAFLAMNLPHLDTQGVFTHFSCAGEEDGGYTLGQLDHFNRALHFLEARLGRKIPYLHAANSGATLGLPETHFNMVRAGLALYGISPNPGPEGDGLRPAMELKTRIIQVRPFAEGEFISYGRTYQTGPGQIIAAVPIGYADGLNRALSNKMEMLVRGQRVKQVGRICMDMCMLDVTEVKKVSLGDEITVFGRDGEKSLSVAEHAALAGTIPYELLTAVSPRVPRIYSPSSLD